MDDETGVGDIAVVGMAGRFPGASTVEQFWENLKAGVESIVEFDDAHLVASGVSKRRLQDPNYVKAGTVLDDADCFDNGFFGIGAREAAATDPQQRLFLEQCVTAIESAGYSPESIEGSVGVFASTSLNTYSPVIRFNADNDNAYEYQKMIGNEKDFLASRVAYHLGLKGPAFTVQCACSSSLVAVHVACQNLLTYQCDMALAGGVSVLFPQGVGYQYQEGMILSPDGHCRAFDNAGAGIVSGRGLGVVVLKRMEEALRDSDRIIAVIKATAVNNDGSDKVGYTAPSVAGQEAVISEALALSGYSARDLKYIEAHGTGTPLGDPIEIEALSRAYAEFTDDKQFCKIGSVKTNIGHLDAAAGISGLIKAALVAQHGQIPPSLNFSTPNGQIDFENTPFKVVTELTDISREETPTLCGVSSFGIGGTNAHVILEQPPSRPKVHTESDGLLMIPLSAKSQGSLTGKIEEFAAFLTSTEETLTDIQFTLREGRTHYPFRRLYVADTRVALENVLELPEPPPEKAMLQPRVVFLFTGQGSQYCGMFEELYEKFPVYREYFDRCNGIYTQACSADLKRVINGDQQRLNDTEVTQPALFAVEYALAQLMISWGVKPDAMIGHSIGEYVAACVSGVLAVEDAMRLVIQRGKLMQSMAGGAMIAVNAPTSSIQRYLDDELNLAAENTDSQCVLAGSYERIAAVTAELQKADIMVHQLATSHAFHSFMMDPMLDDFRVACAAAIFSRPGIPWVSNVSGQFVTELECSDPDYWVSHVRSTVRFSDCVDTVMSLGNVLFVEIGPGATLAKFVERKQLPNDVGRTINTVRQKRDSVSDVSILLRALGGIWENGVELDWDLISPLADSKRVSVPTYPFERRRHWLEENANAVQETPGDSEFSKVVFEQSVDISIGVDTVSPGELLDEHWVLLVDEAADLTELVARYTHERGCSVTVVVQGAQFRVLDKNCVQINAESLDDYRLLCENIALHGRPIVRVIHGWGVMPAGTISPAASDLSPDRIMAELVRNYYSLAKLASTLCISEAFSDVSFHVLGTGLYGVERTNASPLVASLLGTANVIAQEYPGTRVTLLDVPAGFPRNCKGNDATLVLGTWINADGGSRYLYKGMVLKRLSFEPVSVEVAHTGTELITAGAVYLIVGGAGGIGRVLTQLLIEDESATVVWLVRNSRAPQCRTAMALYGAKLQIHEADIANRDSVMAALEIISAADLQFDGIFHLAGDLSDSAFGPIAELTTPSNNANICAKVMGSFNVNLLAESLDVNFVYLFGSISTWLGGSGYCAYAAANAAMLSLASHFNTTARSRWLVNSWDKWTTVVATGDDDRSIGSSEGKALLRESLQLFRESPLIVCKADISALHRQWIESDLVAAGQSNSDGTDNSAAGAHDAQNDLEVQISSVWASVLGVETFSRNDSFQDLGGDSLIALTVASRCKALGIRLSSQAITENPTLAGCSMFAQFVDQAVVGQVVAVEDTMTHFRPSPFVLRYLQERGDTNPNLWNISGMAACNEKLDAQTLQHALELLVQDHHVLRIRVSEDHDPYSFVTRDNVPLDSVFHHRVRSADETGESLHTYLTGLANSLNIVEGPLFKVVLIDLPEDLGQRLFVSFHHFVMEGVSWDLFWARLESVYCSLSADESLPALMVDYGYGQWCQRMEQRANDDEATRALAANWLEQPWDRIQPLPADFDADAEEVNLNGNAREHRLVVEGVVPALRHAARKCSRSIDKLVLSSLVAGIGHWSGNAFCHVDRLIQSRHTDSGDQLDTDDSIGCFVSYSPVIMPANDTFNVSPVGDFLARDMEANIQSGIAGNLIKYLSDDTALKAQLLALPKAEILFNYRGPLKGQFEASRLFSPAADVLVSDHDPLAKRYYPISVSCDEQDDDLIVKLVFCSQLHEPSTIEKIALRMGEHINFLKKL